MLKIEHASHSFNNSKVLHDVNLTIERGSFVALIGASGCGKTTLLKAILGTHPLKDGKVFINDSEVTSPTRDIGIVYQKYTLFPHLTVEQNVAEGLKLDQTSIPFRMFLPWKWQKIRQAQLEESRKLLTKIGLGHALKQFPANLSGGMQQRAAIAQALITKPDILLLDEPFGALDQHTRQELQHLILDLYRENLEAKKQGKVPPYTVILVTHELNEAFLLADRVIGLSKKWQYGETEGATVIFDKMSPNFNDLQERDYNHIALLAESCYKIVVANDGVVYDPAEHRTFEVEKANLHE